MDAREGQITERRVLSNEDLRAGTIRSEFGSYSPGPDSTEAKRVAELLKGEVIEETPVPREHNPEIAF